MSKTALVAALLPDGGVALNVGSNPKGSQRLDPNDLIPNQTWFRKDGAGGVQIVDPVSKAILGNYGGQTYWLRLTAIYDQFSVAEPYVTPGVAATFAVGDAVQVDHAGPQS